jgi:SAM-dependent methyltransferase
MISCPNCGGDTLSAQKQEIRLSAILRGWEAGMGITFPQTVWGGYAHRLEEPIRLHSCRVCRLEVFLPIVVGTHEFYQAITPREDSYYVSEKWEFNRAIKAIKKRPPGSVLDIGCGGGAFLSQLAQVKGVSAFGLEFNESAAAWARSKGHRLLDRLSREEAPVGGFDTVTLFQILEHLEAPFQVVKQVKEVMKPGGLMIMTVPDAGGPVHHFSDALTDLPPHHVTRWHERTVRVCAQRHGLKVLEIATEPLPYYVWDYYLPVILEHDLLPSLFGKVLNRTGITSCFLRILRRLGVRHLWPLRGHTLYAVFEV